MGSRNYDFAMGIGGEAGQGIATPGDILARIFVRRGLHLNTYNAYQSIIRGGHIFLVVRVSDEELYSHGDSMDLLLCLNQDTMDRHLGLMGRGSRVVYNGDNLKPGDAREGAHLCPLPVGELTNSRNRLMQNTVAVGSIISLMGLDFSILEDSLRLRFARQGRVGAWRRTSGWPGPGTTTPNPTSSPSPWPRPWAQRPRRSGRATRRWPWEARQPG